MNQDQWVAKAFDKAGREVLSGAFEPAIWALVLSQSGGDEALAKSEYVKARVVQLQQAYRLDAQRQQEAAQRKHEERQREASMAESVENFRRWEAAQRSQQRARWFYQAGKRWRALLTKVGW